MRIGITPARKTSWSSLVRRLILPVAAVTVASGVTALAVPAGATTPKPPVVDVQSAPIANRQMRRTPPPDPTA